MGIPKAPVLELTQLAELVNRLRDGVDRTSALFSEPTGRVLVSVGREDDVKFVGLCEARGIPVLRIGVTDNSGTLEIQDVAGWQLSDLRAAHKGTLAELFGPAIYFCFEIDTVSVAPVLFTVMCRPETSTEFPT